jgi:heme/copper-type cytochrome/quinol oxidase subunit 2
MILLTIPTCPPKAMQQCQNGKIPTQPQLSPPIIRSVNAILSSIQSPPFMMLIVCCRFEFNYSLNKKKNKNPQIRSPSTITQIPIIRVFFIAFFSLNFEIIFSVGNEVKVQNSEYKQLIEATIVTGTFANGNKNIRRYSENTNHIDN